MLGKQVEFVTEDNQSSNPGAVLAFSKLKGQPDIVAFPWPGPVDARPDAMRFEILTTGKPVASAAPIPHDEDG